jgi:hypothetical protein
MGHQTTANNLVASHPHQFHTLDRLLFVTLRVQETNPREMHTTNPVVHALVSMGHQTTANNLITSRLHQRHTLGQLLFVTPRAQETNPPQIHTTNPDAVHTLVSVGHPTTATNDLVIPLLHQHHNRDQLSVTPRNQGINPRVMHATNPDVIRAPVSVGHPTLTDGLITLRPHSKPLFVSHRTHDSSSQ